MNCDGVRRAPEMTEPNRARGGLYGQFHRKGPTGKSGPERKEIGSPPNPEGNRKGITMALPPLPLPKPKKQLPPPPKPAHGKKPLPPKGPKPFGAPKG